MRSSPGGLPRSFWLLWVGAFINRLGGFVVPFLALYLTGERGMSPAHAGAVVSLFGLGSVASGPLGGVLADRLGRRRTLLVGLCGGALAMLHLGFSRAPLHLAGAALLLGLLGDLYRPALHAAIADVVPPAGRARAFAALYWAVNLGFAVASVIAGALAGRSFLALFVGDAVTTLLFAALVYAWVPETQDPEHRAHARSRGAAQMVLPLRDGVFICFVVLVFCVALMFMQSLSSLPLDLRAHGVPPQRYGMLLAVNGVLIVVLQPFAASGAHRFRRSRVLALSALLVGFGLSLNAWATGLAGYAISICVWTLGEILLSPIAPAVVADLAPPSQRGAYQGVYQMAYGGAIGAAPLLGTWALDRFGSSVLWRSCAVLGCAVAALHLAIAGARRRRIAELRADAAM